MRTQEVSLNVNNFTLVSNKVKQFYAAITIDPALLQLKKFN